MPVRIRVLRDDEPIPTGEPMRFVNWHGYVMLRWRVGVNQRVEIREHRLLAGRPPVGMHVHHKNGNKTDNRPENLEVLTPRDHHHLLVSFDCEKAAEMYRTGMSTPDIGKALGIAPSCVYRALKSRGVKLRSLAESRQLKVKLVGRERSVGVLERLT